MRGVLSLAFALAGVLCLSSAAHAQAGKPDSTLREVLLQQWNDIGEKVVKLAEGFPEDKSDYRPVADVRTFADVLRHVGFWNQYVTKSARGEKADGRQNELSKAEYSSKASIVKVLKSSVAEAAEALSKAPEAPAPRLAGLFTAFIGHSSEHYGQLVVYYRLNGIVPPASRGSQD